MDTHARRLPRPSANSSRQSNILGTRRRGVWRLLAEPRSESGAVVVIVTSRRTRQACGARSCLQPHASSKFCWARYSQSAGRTSILLCVELHRGCGPWKSLHATRLAGRCVVAVPGEVQAVDGVVAMLVQVWRSSGVARPRAPF
jgi:hypothetical protein